MARLTDNEKSLLLADYKTNKYSQRDLSKKYNVSLGTVSKMTKEVIPNNEHIVNAQLSVLKAKAELPDIEMNAIMNTAQDELRRKNLVYGVSERIISKANEMLDITDTAQDLKALSDTVDKTSITLGVNQRHSNSQVNIQNTNAVQNNIEIEWD